MNYDRYNSYNEQKYNRKAISYFLMRKPADKVLIPYVTRISNKKVLEVGVGYGYYTKYYINNNNKIKGIDINPQLGKNLNIEIVFGLANQLKEVLKEKFDCIVSFFMTEYLSYEEMKEFIEQSILLLDEGGKFATTVILKEGLGRLYIMLARIKGINKYNYTIEDIKSIISNKQKIEVQITPLNSVMKIPFAILVEIVKK